MKTPLDPAAADALPDVETTTLPAAVTPARVRNASLVVLAVLASLYALQAASSVFVPVLLGVMFSYAMTPLVNRLVQWHVPRGLAAALLLISLVGGTGWLAWSLADDAVEMIETLPQAAQKLRQGIERLRRGGSVTTIETVQQAANEIERAAEEPIAAAKPPPRGVARVQIEKPPFNIKDHLWPGAVGLAAGTAQALVVVFITFFLLASGDTFRRKMVRIAGPSFSEKRSTLQALDEIDTQIQRYLLVQVVTSALVGVATWLVFAWIGVSNAAVWGVAGFALNFIPYLGSIVFTGGAMLFGFVQFGSLEMTALVGGASLLINTLEGYALTPWLTGKASRMNPVAIFVGVLIWGWLWGLWGLFLAVPILMVIKAVCDRVEGFEPLGELLAE